MCPSLIRKENSLVTRDSFHCNKVEDCRVDFSIASLARRLEGETFKLHLVIFLTLKAVVA